METDPKDTWYARELPVLKSAAVLAEDRGANATVAELVQRTGLPVPAVFQALRLLAGSQYLDAYITGGHGEDSFIERLHEKGLRAAGQWPDLDQVGDRLMEALADLANEASDEDTRSRARKALDALKEMGMQTVTGVAVAAVTGVLN